MYKKIEIKSEPLKTRIWADGIEVQGVQKLRIEQAVGSEIPIVELKCISRDLNIEFERADVRFTFKDGWIDVEKCLPVLNYSVLALVKDKHGIRQEVLWREHFEESDAVYEGDYWCGYYVSNIEAMGINKVLAWQQLPMNGGYE